MSRGSRLLIPFITGAALMALFLFFDNSPRLLDELHLPRKASLNTLRFVAWIPLIFFVVRAVDTIVFDSFASRRRNVRAPVLLREIVSIVLFAILFLTALSLIFETKITALLAGGTVLAAVLGLALQETLGNLFAGIALHLGDDFEVGDVIRVGDLIGVVESTRWRGTRVRTFNNTIVVMPNSLLARERLEVFPRRNLNARILQIGIDYNIPPAKVISILTQAAANVDGVSHEMPCFARVAGFGESSVLYDIKYFTGDYSQRDRIDSDIRKNVWYALKRTNIPIPFPIRVHQRYKAPQHAQHPEPDEILQDLAQIDILAPLPEDARAAIAGAAQVRTYSRGETIIRSGAEDHSMFIVRAGEVSVRVGDEEVARLGAGDFFGEMALLTGEARAADVVAITDVVAVEINKSAIEPVLHRHPDLAGAITARVIERRARNASLQQEPREEEQTVLSRIRDYFGL